MKLLRSLVPSVLALISISASATVHYVNLSNSTPVSPFTSWATAATNIQGAVNASVSGDVVMVTNGLYNTGVAVITGGSRVAVDSKAITIRSVNGPTVTTIAGYQLPGTTNGTGAIRCAYLASGAVLAGFTLAQGATSTEYPHGGGVYCQSASSTISNCVLAWNSASLLGGGVYNGRLINCVLFGNSAGSLGGGAHNSQMINCTIVSNTAPNGAGLNDCKLLNSIVYYNYKTNGAADSGGTFYTNCCVNPPPLSLSLNVFSNAPFFAYLAGGDLHLQPGSPCINAGNNTFITNAVDLDGNPRIIGTAVDLGAYESALTFIHYVTLTGATPAPPYTNWPTAATNIQDAIDASSAGEIVLVSNGVYRLGSRAVYGTTGNRVVIDKALSVQSLNGPNATSIVGAGPAATGVRCVYMTNGASLFGFSLSNGVTRGSGDILTEQSGGGVWCESTSAIISNCVFANNYANQGGGGIYQGSLINCTLANNQAFIRGGGACLAPLINCVLSSNNVVQGSGGGGAFGGTLSNCLLIANSAGQGGGVYSNAVFNCTFISNTAGFGGGAYAATLSDCRLTGNRATFSGGGMYGGSANNSLLASNVAALYGGGAHGGNSFFAMHNCTVAANIATNSGGGIFPAATNAIYNSVIYYNLALVATNASDMNASQPIYFCCSPAPAGDFNITNAPAFVDFAGNNFRLQTNSPCINSGKNSHAPPGPDLDGNSRITGGTVDIGAYEFPAPASVISYAWLQQYGLATDGSADYADTDGDGFNNFKEWRCQTSPVDPTSVLKILSVKPDGTNGNVVTWQSVAGLLYYLQRSSNATPPLIFSLIKTNILGTAGATSYTDKTAIGPGPFYYRILVP